MTINLSVVKKTFFKKRSVLYCFLIACFVFVVANGSLISKSVYSSLLLCAKYFTSEQLNSKQFTNELLYLYHTFYSLSRFHPCFFA